MKNKILICICMSVLLFAVSGCSTSGAKEEYDKVTNSSAYKVFNFARNATNPLYYAEKAAKAGYDKYKESKGEK